MKKLVLALFAVSIMACFVVLLNGCETTSASESPIITPSSTVIKKGNAVEFNASGGFEYEWSLSNEGLGRLDTRRGPKVVYRSMYEPVGTTSVIQILTVTSTIQGSSQTTNSTSYERTAEAYITHISSSN